MKIRALILGFGLLMAFLSVLAFAKEKTKAPGPASFMASPKLEKPPDPKKESALQTLEASSNPNEKALPANKESSDLEPVVESVAKKPEGTVSQKIKELFQDFISILESKKVQSPEYSQAVSFLEQSLYNQADFETLKVLSQIYEQKEDFKNQENVLKVLTLSKKGSKNPESFYLLAGAYKNLLSKLEEESPLEWDEESEEYKEYKEYTEYKAKMFANYKKALKKDSKHLPSYMALLDLLKIKIPETQEEKHSKASLSLILEMLKELKDNKYYSLLCKAYYDNRFLKQARRACFRSIKKNPRDPVSPLILSLSLADKKRKEETLILTAKNFPESFFVQYQVGLYFREHSSRSAILYLTQAHKLDANHLALNKILAEFLLEHKEFDSSYDYYLQACLLSEGAFLPAFRQARGMVLRNNKAPLVLKFDEGIKECFQQARQKKGIG